MSRATIRIGDYYLGYSTVQDAPVEYGLKLEDYRKWYAVEYGRAGISSFNMDVVLADRGGERRARDILSCNRSGKNSRKLSFDNIYRAYCLREEINGWSPSQEEDKWRSK